MIEIEPTQKQLGSIIWLHGLGVANKEPDPMIARLDAGYLRFIMPTAPLRHITINQGTVMPAWYDILSFDDPPIRAYEPHIKQVMEIVYGLIQQEKLKGIPASRIMIGGFSQGGAIALHIGLRFQEVLAGIINLSGYLLFPEQFERERSAASHITPFLFYHGQNDQIMPYGIGRAGYERLRKAKHHAEWIDYPAQHDVHPEAVDRIRLWIKNKFFKYS